MPSQHRATRRHVAAFEQSHQRQPAPFVEPLTTPPLSFLQQAGRDADNQAAGVDVGEAVFELKKTLEQGIPVNVKVSVDSKGNLQADVENDPGIRRDG